MDAAKKRTLSNACILVVVFATAFGLVFRLLHEDLSSPGPGSLVLFACSLFCLAGLGFVASLTGRARVRVLGLDLLILLLLVSGILTSAFASPTPFLSAAAFLPFAANLLFFLVIVFGGDDREFGKFFLKAALGVVLVQAGLGIYQVYAAPSSNEINPLRGTYSSPGHIAGMLAMMIPVAAGLLINAIHERLDRAIWPRRVLYALAVVFLAGGLYYTGSEITWITLALGMGAALVLTGKTYLARNQKAFSLTVVVFILLAVVATAFQTHSSFHITGYGQSPDRIENATQFIQEDIEVAVRSPLLGAGYDRDVDRLPPVRAPVSAAARPAFSRLAAEGGMTALAAMFLFFAVALALFWEGMKSPVVDTLEPRVEVGHRRTLKAIELTSIGVLGGSVAFFATHLLNPGISRVTFLLVFLTLWILIVTSSFSYKHFKAVVENQRDFVAIGAITGAIVGVLRSFLTGDLLHPPTQCLLFLLLGVALSRTIKPDRARTLRFRSPKFLRPLLGLLCGLTALCAIALVLWGWPREAKKASFVSRVLHTDAPRESVPQASARVRTIRKLAREYRVDAHLWAEMGVLALGQFALESRVSSLRGVESIPIGGEEREAFETHVDLFVRAVEERQGEAAESARAEVRTTVQAWLGAPSTNPWIREAASAFRKARRFSRSHRLRGEEGWAWVSAAMSTRPPSRALLIQANACFLEALRIAPTHAAHRAGLGETLFWLGAPAEANRAFSRALRDSAEGGPRSRLSQERLRRVHARLAAAKEGG
ncbi:MAG: O-antigen ligase family protein [Planctomycetota bacterium]|jgi:hypothetical protein